LSQHTSILTRPPLRQFRKTKSWSCLA